VFLFMTDDESRDVLSPVGIADTTVIAVTRQSIRVSIPGKDRNVCHSVQTGSGNGGFPWG
jgi:hypothetical protein